VRALEGAHKQAAVMALFVAMFLGQGTAAALTEPLWSHDTAWVLVILTAVVLLIPSIPTFVIRKAGLKSASYAYIGLLFSGFVLLVDLILGGSVCLEIWAREFGNTTEGVIVNRRTEPGSRQSTNHYAVYEFSVEGGSERYTKEQEVHPERYGRLGVGSSVEIAYLPSYPASSFLKESGFLKDSISILLGLNFTSLFLFPALLLVDKHFGRIGRG
jgi:hypothetical protein